MNSNDIHGMALALGLPSAIAQIEAVKLLVAEAVANEREACANVCEEEGKLWSKAGCTDTQTFSLCATVIRARGEA